MRFTRTNRIRVGRMRAAGIENSYPLVFVNRYISKEPVRVQVWRSGEGCSGGGKERKMGAL
jgi:hypothetical protein